MASASGSRLLVTGVMMSNAHSSSSLGCARSSFLGRNTRSMLYLDKKQHTQKPACLFSTGCHVYILTQREQGIKLATSAILIKMYNPCIAAFNSS